jgi:hypothetical protein
LALLLYAANTSGLFVFVAEILGVKMWTRLQKGIILSLFFYIKNLTWK